MKINYVLSDTTKKATSATLSKVISQAESNLLDDFVVIVPETKSIIIERELLSLSKSHALVNVYVYSFVRLLKRIGFVPEEKIVTKPACVLLLRKIILENFDRLVCYKKSAKTIGFAEKMYETIAQLKSSGVGFEDIQNLDKIKSESLKAKLTDIALIYKEYETQLSDELFDDLDKLALLSKLAESSDFIKKANVFVVGFDNITFEMEQVLKSLASNAKEITFSCVYFGESCLHHQSNELYNKLKHIGDMLRFPYNPEFVKTELKPDFEAISKHLFNPAKKDVGFNDIHIFNAKTKKIELDYVANQILFEVASGKRFKDIGVLVTDIDASAKTIMKCFDSYAIPYFINQEYDVSTHFYVKFLTSAFELVSSGLASQKVLEFVSSPIFDEDGFADFKNFVIGTGINYKDFLNNFDDTLFDSDIQKNNSLKILGKFQKFYNQFADKIKDAVCFSDYTSVAEFVSEFFDAKTKLSNISKSQQADNFKIEAELTNQIYEKVNKFLLLSSNILGNEKMSASEFLLLFKSGFSVVKASVAPVSVDAVIVQENTDGFFDIKDLFIVGAEEGKFPSKIQDTGVILDAELEEAKLVTQKAVDPTVKQINKRESFRVFESLLEPKENLFISFSDKDISGASQKSSRIVLNLIRLFGEKILSKTYRQFGFVNAKNEEMKLAKNISRFLSFGEVTLDELQNQYAGICESISPEFKNHLSSINAEPNFVIPGIKDLIFKDNKTSISQLEKYFACPYLFFVNYALRLKENKDAKISSMDVGNIMHRIAELFMLRFNEFENLTDNDFESSVEKLFFEVIKEQNIKEKQNKALIVLILNEAKRLCKYMRNEQHNSSFKVQNLEFEFSGDTAIKLTLDDGKTISIQGKIDRTDKFGDYIRVIDYKTGDIKSELKSVYVGEKIQLISYLSAIMNNSEQRVAGVFYLPIHSEYQKDEKKLKAQYKMEGFILDDAEIVKYMDAKLSFENSESTVVPAKLKTNKKNIEENKYELYAGAKVLSADEFENLKTYVEKLCKVAVSEILDGFIAPSPLEKNGKPLSRCEYCDYAGFCGLEKSKFADGRQINSKITKDNFILKEENGRN